MTEDNNVCKAHSGFVRDFKNIDRRFETMDRNISGLWKKWNGMTYLLVATLTGVVVNLLLQVFKQ
jgi:hypothetical protein